MFNPEINVVEFSVKDVITTSTTCITDGICMTDGCANLTTFG